MAESNLSGVAGSLAGAMALAAGTNAYASVIPVQTPTDVSSPAAPPGGISSVNWDIDNDGSIDLYFEFHHIFGGSLPVWSAHMRLLGSGVGVMGHQVGNGMWANRLNAGVAVGPGQSFLNPPSHFALLASWYYNYGEGHFFDGQSGYIGFTFQSNGQQRYGWLQLRTSELLGIDFIAAAYENSGAAIMTGEVPAPGTLAALAFGATATLNRRKRLN